MNAKLLMTAVFTLAVAGSAFAQAPAPAKEEARFSDATYPLIPASGKPQTRAQVMAELAQARANGELNVSDSAYPLVPAVASTLPRAEVMAEFFRARAAGEIPVNEGDYDVAQTRRHVAR